MRTAFNSYPIKNSDGKIYAFCLGSDYCAEHEWGIEPLIGFLQIDTSLIGLESRTAIKNDRLAKFLTTDTSNGNFYIGFSSAFAYYKATGNTTRLSTRDSRLYIVKDGMGAAWSDSEFGIVANKKEQPEVFAFLKLLEKAIPEGDIAVWFASRDGNNPFGRSGLVVGIASMVPDELKNVMTQADLDRIKLSNAHQATGIAALLKEKGKKYYACSPRWITDETNRPATKYNHIYWLNPAEQSSNNHGWFTVEELTDWANDVVGNKIDKKYDSVNTRK